MRHEGWNAAGPDRFLRLCSLSSLGFDNGRISALVDAQAEDVSGNAATALVARLADLLGDTEAGHFDVLLALVAALRATVMTARGEQPAHR